MTDAEIQKLLDDGVIRKIKADTETARVEVATARSHLDTAATAARSDPNGAFQLVYDAARKAISAHMRANGYRVGRGQGAHMRTGRYAEVALPGVDPRHLDAFEDLRSIRNQSEYDALLLEEHDALEALEHATAIVDAVDRDLR